MSGRDLVIHHSDFPSGIRLCVGAVVLRGEKVLFVRQTYGKLKGMWSLPWGLVEGMGADGHPEPPDEAAMREMRRKRELQPEWKGCSESRTMAPRRGSSACTFSTYVATSAASRRPTTRRQTELPTFPWTK